MWLTFMFHVTDTPLLCPSQIGVTRSEAPEGVCFIARLSPLSFTDPSALRAPSPSPDVRLGSLTLMRHKMTFGHFSKGLIRPNLGEERRV